MGPTPAGRSVAAAEVDLAERHTTPPSGAARPARPDPGGARRPRLVTEVRIPGVPPSWSRGDGPEVSTISGIALADSSDLPEAAGGRTRRPAPAGGARRASPSARPRRREAGQSPRSRARAPEEPPPAPASSQPPRATRAAASDGSAAATEGRPAAGIGNPAAMTGRPTESPWPGMEGRDARRKIRQAGRQIGEARRKGPRASPEDRRRTRRAGGMRLRRGPTGTRPWRSAGPPRRQADRGECRRIRRRPEAQEAAAPSPRTAAPRLPIRASSGDPRPRQEGPPRPPEDPTRRASPAPRGNSKATRARMGGRRRRHARAARGPGSGRWPGRRGHRRGRRDSHHGALGRNGDGRLGAPPVAVRRTPGGRRVRVHDQERMAALGAAHLQAGRAARAARRSGMGALHDSHSTFSIGPGAERITQSRRVAIVASPRPRGLRLAFRAVASGFIVLA